MVRLDVEVETVFILESLSTGEAHERMHRGLQAAASASTPPAVGEKRNNNKKKEKKEENEMMKAQVQVLATTTRLATGSDCDRE